MRRFTFLVVCCAAYAASGCTTKNENPNTSDTAAGAVAAQDSAGGGMALTPAAVEGRWNILATPEGGGADSMVAQYVLNATGDPKTWTITYPGRQPVPIEATFSGDSIITKAGPYQSFRRRGVRVQTEGVIRLEGERLVGRTVAHYRTSGPDSVLRLRTEGTRAP